MPDKSSKHDLTDYSLFLQQPERNNRTGGVWTQREAHREFGDSMVIVRATRTNFFDDRRRLNLFERYPTLWVALCMIVGVTMVAFESPSNEYGSGTAPRSR